MIKINGITIGETAPVFIIALACNNHIVDLNNVKEMVTWKRFFRIN